MTDKRILVRLQIRYKIKCVKFFRFSYIISCPLIINKTIMIRRDKLLYMANYKKLHVGHNHLQIM